MTPQPVSVTELLPHRPPMLLLDALESFSAQAARAVLEVRADNPFLRPDGFLERAAFAEMLAQCFAAGFGACLRAAGQRAPGWGYLAALREVVVQGDARLGQRLAVTACLTARLGNIAVVTGEVWCGEKLLASGQIKVFLPEEE